MIKTITTNLEVDTKIVRLLSKSTYQRSFSSAIRELVSNAYDADSLSVEIKISDDYDSIIITDDGNGMTYNEFQRYLTIAGNKSKKEQTRKFRRNRIGQFGIGFLSIFPFCSELEIITTSENSTELLSTIIPAQEYMDTGKELNVSDIPIVVKIAEKAAELKSHYTIMKLIKPTYLVSNYFEEINTKKRDSIYAWKPFSRFLWELSEDLPVSYKNKDDQIEEFLSYDEPIGISVYVNGEEINRNPLPRIVLEKEEQIIGGINFKFIYSSDFKSIKPFEARGIKIRVNNVGVGKRTDFALKRDRGFSRLHWISGELQIESKIKSFLSINRDEFISSPTIDEIIEYCAEKLRKSAYYIEGVDLAEKNIKNSFRETIRDKVQSKREIIRKNIKALENKGFEVKEDFDRQSTISIDKQAKTIYINKTLEEIGSVSEKIEVLGEEFVVEYVESLSIERPCEFMDNVIKINKNYPLFSSKTYGSIFKKISLLLLVRQEKGTIDKKTYDLITDDLVKEFKDYI